MTRLARDFSWHLLALTMIVAGLGVLAPLAWWHAPAPHQRKLVQHAPSQRDWTGISAQPAPAPLSPPPEIRQDWNVEVQPEPKIAVLRPQIADDIRLDPSVTESPALPAAVPTSAEATLPELPAPAVAADAPRLADPSILGDAPGPADAPSPTTPSPIVEPRPELRLSATATRATLSDLPDLTNLPPIQEPTPASLPSVLESPSQGSPTPETPAVPEAESLAPLPPATKAWPYPSGLIEQLNVVAATVPAARAWTDAAKAELEQLVALDSLAAPAVAGHLTRLRALAEGAKSIAPADDIQSRSKLLRAGYAIVRRLVIWDQVHALASRQDLDAIPVVDRAATEQALAEVDKLLQATGAAANWRKYLLVDRAHDQLGNADCSPADQRQLARDMLHRMHSTQLSHDQLTFLRTPPFVDLGKQLESLAAEAPRFVELLSAIEAYEHIDESEQARTLALAYEALRWSPAPAVRELADSVNSYYRNANVRVALSAELLNRMIPPQTPQVEAVQDVILGASVHGQSQTNTQLKLALIPDRERWNIGLEANGQVASNTASSKGPATFFQNGWSFFRARKRLTVDRRGIRLFNAEAAADANSNLDDFETDFDGIPLLGGIARSIARSQYEESQPAAKVEVEGRIVIRATSQLDREVATRLEQAKRDFQVKIAMPLQQLNLEPTAVDLETTADRLIARYRVAAREQISAHTPRPQAPGDSLLSVQVHETALNNVLDKLPLAGRRIELRALYEEMTLRFRGQKLPVPDDLPEDVYVTFADRDAVRLDCQDGRIRLTIRLKELAQGTKNKWVNFTVRGYYVPNADQLDANLVRDGVIELIGDGHQIPFGQQVALRGIFSRVLSRNRKLYIVNKQIAEAKELRDQQVTQFVIHDGWVGIALGPKAPGRQAAMHPRPDTRQE